MAIIAIVGAGMMGTALCWPLSENNHTVRLVGTPLDHEIIRSIHETRMHPKLEREIPLHTKAYLVNDLEEALNGVDLIVNGVSSFGTDWFSDTVGPLFRPHVPVIAVTKGLDVLPDGDLCPLPDYINERLPARQQGRISLNAIAGPCIAHELAARRQTCVVFCGKDPEIVKRLRDVFETPYYHIWVSTDLKEVEICAALKNGYALGVGIAVGLADREGVNGLANMYNPQAAVFAQSCLEIRTLIRTLGGNEEAVSWLPGAGDLYVTVFGGRTRRLGRLIGLGHSAAEAIEIMSGVTLESVEIVTRVAEAVRRLANAGRVSLEQFPLLMLLDGVINHDIPAIFPWHTFFSTQKLGSRQYTSKSNPEKANTE